MAENLWERAMTMLYGATGAVDDPKFKREIDDIITEMERVECVEGCLGPGKLTAPSPFWPHEEPVDDDRPALLLLLKEDR